MVLILCEEADVAAAWAAGRLRQRGVATDTVTGADLAVAGRLEHRVGRSGATFELELAGGRRIGVVSGFDALTLTRLIAVLEQR